MVYFVLAYSAFHSCLQLYGEKTKGVLPRTSTGSQSALASFQNSNHIASDMALITEGTTFVIPYTVSMEPPESISLKLVDQPK